MGWFSDRWDAFKGGVEDVVEGVKDLGQGIIDVHKKVFEGVFIDPIKKAWENKYIRTGLIVGAVALGGAGLMGMGPLAGTLGGAGQSIAGMFGAGAASGPALVGSNMAGGIYAPIAANSVGGAAAAAGGGFMNSLGGAALVSGGMQLGGSLLGAYAQGEMMEEQNKREDAIRNAQSVYGMDRTGQGGFTAPTLNFGQPGIPNAPQTPASLAAAQTNLGNIQTPQVAQAQAQQAGMPGNEPFQYISKPYYMQQAEERLRNA